MNRSGDAESDWRKANCIYNSTIRRVLFQINQPLILVERRVVEPFASWVDSADLFRIIDRVSPALEALGVLAIPLVLFVATQNYQERVIKREKAYQEDIRQQESERLQQQAVKDYLTQLSTLLLDLDGDLIASENRQLRTLVEATTLTLLREPNLNGDRKGQVIKFLSQMELINVAFLTGPNIADDRGRVSLSLRGANLRESELYGVNLSLAYLWGADLENANLQSARLFGAELTGANLRGASLLEADLRTAHLNGAHLNGADLRGANFNEAMLPQADLSKADLYQADLSKANLRSANLSGANLRSVDLRGAALHKANLSGVDLSVISSQNLSREQIDLALLCRTQLPEEMNLDPDRDCEDMGLDPMTGEPIPMNQ